MGLITLGFSTDKSDFISSIIRLLTWSRFSHVVLISPDSKTFIESTHGKGVQERPIEEFLSQEDVEFGTVYHPDSQLVWDLAKKEVGKPYDDKYIYGWLCRRNWQDDKKWACCELVPAIAIKAGYSILRTDCIYKITPEHLHMITQEIKWPQ